MRYSIEKKRDIVEQVSARVANGESVRNILGTKGMPSTVNYYRWLNQDKELKDIHWSGMGVRAHEWFEQLYQVATDGSKDYEFNKDGKLVFQKEHVMRSRLVVDTLKWMAAKAHPMYSDYMQVAPTTKIESITVNIESSKEKVIDI